MNYTFAERVSQMKSSVIREILKVTELITLPKEGGGIMVLHYEPMTEKHGKEIIDIFNYYVENSYAAYPEQKLLYDFFNKFLEMTRGYPAFIIKNITGKIVGFCFLRAHNPLPVFRETAEISYFLKEDEVGKGIGKYALGLLEKEGKAMGIKYILASISSYNEQSLCFHKKNGFIECGRFRNIGKKKGKNFDVVWMEKEI
ncbi:N-acetyltransferase family protein [Pelotomaculum isophthalicicum JI]|uniref:N-acetyltransferase family protein n=1 Tax=Pelotomaculum isophthalicicum JI TaxID=947010 RepID=A0A9X4H3F3_9FIRM|nr:GNAT family N-acetyltransferase [Pelotomaculum isophthalicicum]MDF9409621.1 N-acetyltransferase family protein [Pelotomaculum isophthalicicum JI]